LPLPPLTDTALAPSTSYCYQVRAIFRQTVLNGTTSAVVVFPSGQTAERCVVTTAAVPSDLTPPVIGSTVTPTVPDGSNGWDTGNVSLAWIVTEPEAPGSLVNTGCDEKSITSDQPATTYSCAATSDGGSAGPVDRTIKRDASAPTVPMTCPVGAILKGSTATAGWTASDPANGSGLATASGGVVALDTATVGNKTATAPQARDDAGNTSATTTCSYNVAYDFDGFCHPIDMGNVFNAAKAGSTIPVKFSLGGDEGLRIFETGYPKVTAVTCTSGAATDKIEELSTATTSGLKYDAAAGQYNYTWKATTSLANSCAMLTVRLVDGTSKAALFKFTK